MVDQLSVFELLKLGHLRSEKCDLAEAGRLYTLALERAKSNHDLRGTGEALAMLLRHSSDIADDKAQKHWANELETFMTLSGAQTIPSAWYCKGIVSFREGHLRKAQVLFHRFLKETRKLSDTEDAERHSKWMAQALIALARVAFAKGKIVRARFLTNLVMKDEKAVQHRGIQSTLYFFMSGMDEKQGQLESAKAWLEKAHLQAMREHNWLHYLHVLLAKARICRIEQDFVQSRFFLGLVEAAAGTDDLKAIRQEAAEERSKLNIHQVDLELDLNRRTIRTKESEVHLGRQHILLEIVLQLTKAKDSQGLTKSDIIEKVWNENYNPDVHDGKLYYNINRLRKLIEPDIRKPQYVLNARAGYRLAPELKIRVIDGMNGH